MCVGMYVDTYISIFQATALNFISLFPATQLTDKKLSRNTEIYGCNTSRVDLIILLKIRDHRGLVTNYNSESVLERKTMEHCV